MKLRAHLDFLYAMEHTLEEVRYSYRNCVDQAVDPLYPGEAGDDPIMWLEEAEVKYRRIKKIEKDIERMKGKIEGIKKGGRV